MAKKEIDLVQAAAALGVSTARVRQLILENRLVGQRRVGGVRGVWVVTADANGRPIVLPRKKPVQD